ncbi:hypothetical protein D3C73_1634960 [compost metagenome]
MSEFGILEEEALGRLNNHFANYEETVDMGYLLYESPKDSSYIIYYGYDSHWWNKSKEELFPLPYP